MEKCYLSKDANSAHIEVSGNFFHTSASVEPEPVSSHRLQGLQMDLSSGLSSSSRQTARTLLMGYMILLFSFSQMYNFPLQTSVGKIFNAVSKGQFSQVTSG